MGDVGCGGVVLGALVVKKGSMCGVNSINGTERHVLKPVGWYETLSPGVCLMLERTELQGVRPQVCPMMLMAVMWVNCQGKLGQPGLYGMVWH